MAKSNKRARGWIKQKIKYLTQEGYSQSQSVAIALAEAKKHRLINDGELQEISDELRDAEDVARGFHGRDVQDQFEEIEQHQYRAELAQLGELVELEVYTPNQKELVVLTYDRQDPVRVAASSDRKQLFLVGGDTTLDEETLQSMAICGADKDKVPIGWVYSISYFADKHHLTGPKQQKKGTEYIHEFGEQTGKRLDVLGKVEQGKLPQLVYDRLNCSLELIGGGYEIRDEGIWD